MGSICKYFFQSFYFLKLIFFKNNKKVKLLELSPDCYGKKKK